MLLSLPAGSSVNMYNNDVGKRFMKLLLPDTEVEFAGHATPDLTSTSASAVP